MKSKDTELIERAMKLLCIDSRYDLKSARKSFIAKMKLVHPDGPNGFKKNVPGFDNTEIARLLIQAYGLIIKRNFPTSMLENDFLVGTMLNGEIVPISQTTSAEKWSAEKFYDQFNKSIWPNDSENNESIKEWKFQGL